MQTPVKNSIALLLAALTVVGPLPPSGSIRRRADASEEERYSLFAVQALELPDAESLDPFSAKATSRLDRMADAPFQHPFTTKVHQLVGGEKNVKLFERLAEILKRRDGAPRVTLMLRGKADIATPLLTTDPDDLIIVDPLPMYSPAESVEPMNDVIERYLQDTREYGYSSSRTLEDAGGVWPFLIVELQDLGAQFEGYHEPHGKGDPWVITFQWKGRTRRLHYFANTNPENVDAYHPYIQARFGQVDVCMFKAGEYGHDWFKIENDAQGEPIMKTKPERLLSILGPGGYLVSDTPLTLPAAHILAHDYDEIHGAGTFDHDLLNQQLAHASFGIDWLTHGNKVAVYLYRRRQRPRAEASLDRFVLPENFDFRQRREILPALARLMKPGGLITARLFPEGSPRIEQAKEDSSTLQGFAHLGFWDHIDDLIDEEHRLFPPKEYPSIFQRLMLPFYDDDQAEMLPPVWHGFMTQIISIMKDARSPSRARRWYRHERNRFYAELNSARLDLARARALNQPRRFSYVIETYYGFSVAVEEFRERDRLLHWDVQLTRRKGPLATPLVPEPPEESKRSGADPHELIVPVQAHENPPEWVRASGTVLSVFVDWALDTEGYRFTAVRNAVPHIEQMAENLLTSNADKFETALIDMKLFGLFADEIEDRLFEKIYFVNYSMRELFGNPNPMTTEGLQTIFNQTMQRYCPPGGLFLKNHKLEELLDRHPPTTLMTSCATSLRQLIGLYGVRQIFSVTRAFEPPGYMRALVSEYGRMTPEDFEWRPIESHIFPRDRYPGIAPILDLKLPFWDDKLAGTIYGIPFSEEHKDRVPILRAFTRAAHYLSELNGFSIFLTFLLAEDSSHFGRRLQAALSDFEDTTNRRAVAFFSPHHLHEMFAWENSLGVLFRLSEENKGIENLLKPFKDTHATFARLNTSALQSAHVSLNISDIITMASKLRGSVLHAREMMRMALFYASVGDVLEARLLILKNLDLPDLLGPDSPWTPRDALSQAV